MLILLRYILQYLATSCSFLRMLSSGRRASNWAGGAHAMPKEKASSATGPPRARGSAFVPPATITLPPMLKSRRRRRVPRNALPDGADVQPAGHLPRGLRPDAGADRLAVHRADRRRLPAGQRGRLDPRARRPHPARRHPCDHRGRPADRQGPADQAGQHARPPQRAGPAVAQGRGRDPRGQSPAAARQRPAVRRRLARGFRRGVAFPRNNSRSTANTRLAEIRRSERERAEATASRTAGQD